MKCINCKTSEANKESGLCDACENEELSKINGLLYFPALGLILGVIRIAIELYSFTIAAFNYFNETGFLSYYAMGVFVLLICGFIVSIYAAWLFFRRKKGTRKAMIAYYVTGLIIALYLTVLPAIIFDVQQDSDNIILLMSGVFGVVIWIPYFIFSKRINMVFCR
ncbi:DUF2569 domain-containing protein [Shimwellia blattae]|uniref:DUF2569 domain-containing protein n=1 Tax=Shimwellia blattae (strain ATCC 29907 / DSM 4481 / JCM 1650 / NBRC 105725 / CDC 9005-74) TaxID=630626 RepID=I2B6C0_SHIBC|nr:DUF2569 domain-containing protein [Shimwellia blattae]AFJ46074.1 hypothetical protein EBL_c09590 [Shimwellia blattae DSM 4481 = NBRC 105725]GAB83204.1 hypothetical protein EB105725_48_00120 [Shimwellia blattae DSM 4481 = NBRC 105725]